MSVLMGSGGISVGSLFLAGYFTATESAVIAVICLLLVTFVPQISMLIPNLFAK